MSDGRPNGRTDCIRSGCISRLIIAGAKYVAWHGREWSPKTARIMTVSDSSPSSILKTGGARLWIRQRALRGSGACTNIGVHLLHVAAVYVHPEYIQSVQGRQRNRVASSRSVRTSVGKQMPLQQSFKEVPWQASFTSRI